MATPIQSKQFEKTTPKSPQNQAGLDEINRLRCEHVIISNEIDNAKFSADRRANSLDDLDSRIADAAIVFHDLLLEKKARIEEVLENA